MVGWAAAENLQGSSLFLASVKPFGFSAESTPSPIALWQ